MDTLLRWRGPGTRSGIRQNSDGGSRLPSLGILTNSATALLAASILVANVGTAPAQESAQRQVIALGQDGREFAGVLAAFGSGQLTIGAGAPAAAPQRLATKNLISLKFKNRPSIAHASDPLVLLADGNVLALQIVGSDDVALTGRWARFPAWNPVKVPLETLRGLILSKSGDAAADARLWNRLAEHREHHDLVILTNGDSLVGRFAGMDEKTLTFEVAGNKSTIERSGIQAIAFDPDLISSEPLKGEGALLSLTDGSRCRIHSPKLGTIERLECRTAFGATLEIPCLAVESLRFLGGCVTYLSDVEPAQFRFEPYYDLPWPLRRDRSVTGTPLRLRGTTWPRGLGVHSKSEVSYRLDGQYRRFQATIGIDDDTAGKGSAVFEVLVDGKTVFKSENLTGSSHPVVLDRISLTGAKTLMLRVDYGELADIQDHADWCDALLVN